MSLLQVCDVVAGYGETEILHSVSITVERGQIVTIIGPNGSGKSTLHWRSSRDDCTQRSLLRSSVQQYLSLPFYP